MKQNRKIEQSISKRGIPIYCFDTKIFETDLAGEPLYLIQAPKHSWSDTMIVFRGSMITGDWWLGKGDPNPNKIPLDVVKGSIDTLEAFCQEKKYYIHTLFSVHVNEIRRNIDFVKLMEETRPS